MRMTLPLTVTLALVGACSTNPPPDTVYVIDRPPPGRVELVPVAPGPGYAWVAGHWQRAGNGWAWAGGRYVVRPARYRNWAPGAWHHQRHGWYYVEGHWR